MRIASTPALLSLAALLASSVACTGVTRDPASDHALEADPSTVNFGYVQSLQFSEDQQIRLINNSARTVSIEAIRLSEDSDEAFAMQLLPSSLPAAVSAGSEELISIYFAPPSSAEYYGEIEIITDADDGGPLIVPVGGCSTDPECTVDVQPPVGDDDDDDVADDDDDDDTAAGDADIDVTPSSIDFGELAQNQAPIGDGVSIANVGGDPLTISSLSITGSGDESLFGFSGYPASGGTIQPGSAPVNLNVTFSPQGASEGTKTATLLIQSNDPNEGTVEVSLSASVTEDCGLCEPVLQVQDASVVDLILQQILYLQVGTGTVDVIISNIGFGPLPIAPVTEGGSACPDFAAISLTSTPPAELAAGESTTLTFQVGQEGVDVINFGGLYAFTIGTLAGDPLTIGQWALENGCSFSGGGLPI